MNGQLKRATSAEGRILTDLLEKSKAGALTSEELEMVKRLAKADDRSAGDLSAMSPAERMAAGRADGVKYREAAALLDEEGLPATGAGHVPSWAGQSLDRDLSDLSPAERRAAGRAAAMAGESHEKPDRAAPSVS